MAQTTALAMLQPTATHLRSDSCFKRHGRLLAPSWGRLNTPSRHHMAVRGIADDLLAGSGFMDLAKSVSGGAQKKGVYGDLAYKIGKDIYVDVQGWHLFLKDITVTSDVKMAQAVAEHLGPTAGDVSEADLEQYLKRVPLTLGGGKQKVSLFDALPSFAVRDLAEIVKESASR